MCKQEDYFKKLIYMHNEKIYFHVMQAQGGPSRAELWGWWEGGVGVR